MATITIGAGFLISTEQEEALKLAASALPPDWNIEVFGDATTRVFTVTAKGRGLDVYKTFAAQGADEAVTYLNSLRRRHQR